MHFISFSLFYSMVDSPHFFPIRVEKSGVGLYQLFFTPHPINLPIVRSCCFLPSILPSFLSFVVQQVARQQLHRLSQQHAAAKTTNDPGYVSALERYENMAVAVWYGRTVFEVGDRVEVLRTTDKRHGDGKSKTASWQEGHVADINVDGTLNIVVVSSSSGGGGRSPASAASAAAAAAAAAGGRSRSRSRGGYDENEIERAVDSSSVRPANAWATSFGSHRFGNGRVFESSVAGGGAGSPRRLKRSSRSQRALGRSMSGRTLSSKNLKGGRGAVVGSSRTACDFDCAAFVLDS